MHFCINATNCENVDTPASTESITYFFTITSFKKKKKYVISIILNKPLRFHIDVNQWSFISRNEKKRRYIYMNRASFFFTIFSNMFVYRQLILTICWVIHVTSTRCTDVTHARTRTKKKSILLLISHSFCTRRFIVSRS